MSDNIKVVVKVRPLIPREVEDKLSYQWRVQSNTLYQIDENGKNSGAHFTFDKVYDQTTKTSDVYKDVAKPIVEAAIAGFNGTIFAYGQTSSGKTYTMSGTEESPGIIQLAVLNLFERIKCIPDRDFLVRVSYIEIYNETLKDLLNMNNDKVKVRDTLQGVRVEATEKFTSSPEEVMQIMREGVANRAIGATNMNEESSRSHSLFQITIESREHTDGEETAGCINVSTLNLVDLAGSERSGQTGATGIRFKEGTLINKSLSTLALVIKQLSEDPHKHANYRDSKLTRILQNSLGGNAKTSIICAVTPAAVEETISTLQFATRAKAVKNKPEVNAVATDATKLQDLTKQLAKLQSELALKKDIEQDNRNLQKQISGLQKMILNGFGQQSRDTGSRRKTWCAPRRMTISSLPSAEEDKETAVQRFCTPSLKYNPQLVTQSREIPRPPIQRPPIQRPSQLAPVSEEGVMITPPRQDKNIDYNDEIIEIDSDEEATSNTSRCSPYHKCYTASKTPPCVLRKNAKTAEKDLKELVELTNREKIYNPELVEYIEKLEQSTNTIVRLEEEMKELSEKNLEKQCEVKVLEDKIARTKNEVKTIADAKADLEARYKECYTKVTDLEVSYETLRLKAKRREEELLSLLNELEQKQTSGKDSKKTSKNLSRTFDKDLNNFMDMSKDISLVSDHDSTMETTNAGETSVQETMAEMKTQIKQKDEAILNLENDLKQQKLTIESLQSQCEELREQNNKTSTQLEDFDKENTLLKSSIETLNSTIKTQKQSLDMANNDIQSYNTVIEELRNKLAAKTDNIDLNVSDNLLETMIAHEDKVIANNENLKNIINSFKMTLDMRNKEIDTLKSSLEIRSPPRNGQLLSENLQAKEEQIDQLVEQVQISQKQIEENITVINKLTQDNLTLLKEKHELSEKLIDLEKLNSQIEKQNVQLQNKNEEYILKFNKFNENQDTLAKNLNDLRNNLSELQKEKDELCKLQSVVITKDDLIRDLKSEIQSKEDAIDDLTNKQAELQAEINYKVELIADLETEILSKNKFISTLTQEHTELQSEVVNKDNLIADLKSDSLSKDSLISSLSSEHSESQDYLYQFKSVATKLQRLLSALTGDLCVESEIIEDSMVLFNTLCDRLTVVEVTAKEVVSQKELAVANSSKLEQNVEYLQTEIVILTQGKLDAENRLANQAQQIIELTQALEKLNKEFKDVCDAKSELVEQLETSNESNQKLCDQIKEKNDVITSLQNEETELRSRLSEIMEENHLTKTEMENVQSLIKADKLSFDEVLQKKDEEIIELQKLSNMLEETIRDRGEILASLNKAVSELVDKLDIPDFPNNDINGNNIVETLKRAINEVISVKSSNSNNNTEFGELKKKLAKLQDEYNHAQEKLSITEDKNTFLITEIDEIRKENVKLYDDLHQSNEVLQRLQMELKEKLNVIVELETKIKEWRENFAALEESMKRQIVELQETNFELQSVQSAQSNETYSIHREPSGLESYQKQSVRKSLSNILVEPGKFSPQSLLTLCCTKIINVLEPSETSLKSETNSSITFNTEAISTGTQTHSCDCAKLEAEIDIAMENNLNLKAKVDFLEFVNLKLLKDQEEVRKELQLLIEPAYDLQRKISNHKTNLSTLTATTYAENKLLKSQVKVLQHHNNRFLNVCQRDLPIFKKSLQELSSILKSTSQFNRLEANIKRYSLPEVLDSNTSVSNYTDESTLDGDLLMLDTNVTIASVDNTIQGADQTCLDGTQIDLDNDEFNADLIDTIDPIILHTQLQILSVENQKQTKKIEALREENSRLQERLEKEANVKLCDLKVDAQSSPIKLNHSLTQEPANDKEVNTKICLQCSNLNAAHEKIVQEVDLLNKELLEVKDLNSELQKKCQDLNADIIENDKLVLKISALEKENKSKLAEIDQFSTKLSTKAKEIERLQEENDNLSTQVMDAIDESEVLRKELETLKEKIKSTATATCLRCDNQTTDSKNAAKALSPANRSRSDSESTSRFNKLSTLQNELLAGREDCKTISEDVATIKNHLEHGNLTLSHDMGLDVSMGEYNDITINVELLPNTNECKINTVTEESPIDMYAIEKTECFNYYIEKTGAENNLSQEMKIIDIIKLLYNNLVSKHGEEVENLINKLKDFEETRNQLQEKINELDKMHDELKNKNNQVNSANNVISQIKDNLNKLSQEISNSEGEKNSVIVEKFKNAVLNILDTEYQFTSVSIFETLIDKVVDKNQKDLVEIMTRYSELQGNMELLTSELKNVTENLDQMKIQLADKEKEYNLLKAQKTMVHEITNAVTLDLVQQKQTLRETITKGYQSLIENNIFSPDDIDDTLSEDKCITLFIEKLIHQFKQNDLTLQEKHRLLIEVTKSNTMLEEKEQEIESLKSQLEKLHSLCKEATNELHIKNEALETQKSLHEQLNEIYDKKVEENKANIEIIESLTQEIGILKENVETKVDTVQNLREETKAKIAELTEAVNVLEHENKNLKSVNEMITSESEQNAAQLAEADDTIKKNKTELDKMTAEVLLLNQSIKENMTLIEALKLEAKTLLDQNEALKEQCKEAKDLCSQLKKNMKTHEKTAEIQCKIMKRLKQEKEDSISQVNEKTKQVEELTQKCEALQKDCKKLSEDIDKSIAEASELKAAKEALQIRVSELENQLESANKPRASLDNSRRRQSLNQQPDPKKMEAYFSSATKPEDLFMDVDEHSNRSTPVRNRRSDSNQSRNDESERDDGSRPGSAMARRRRRQSTHDMHRRTHLTPDHLNTSGELNKKNNSDLSEVSLKERLEQCQQELEELKERYREVDEECEICAEYLRERDEQCIQLRNENKLLQQQIAEFNGKVQDASCRKEQRDVCVNTDEDWTNLHSVVVDRMSFDREVEKNKVLKRTVDELRCKNADLKTALAKAQKSAERAARSKADLKELEHAKSQLESCKRELEELRTRCQELDEECEICGQYLNDRDEEIARLKAARDALEAKLEEFQNKDAGSKVLSVRKKRQSLHDQNRNSTVESQDASTETNEDLLSYQVERDINSKLHNDEMQQLKLTIEKLSQHNAALETQLRSVAAASAAPPVYVATGSAIVQNQHLTDVMKENQKLKNMNAKLIMICKKRSGKGKADRENDDPADMG